MRPAIRKALTLFRLALVCVALVFAQTPAEAAAPWLDRVVMVAAGDNPPQPAAGKAAAARTLRAQTTALSPPEHHADPDALAAPRLYLRHRALLR